MLGERLYATRVGLFASLLLILALFILLLKQWSENRINRLRASAAAIIATTSSITIGSTTTGFV